MATGQKVYSNLFQLSNFVQQTAVSQGKNLIIDALREYFRKDTFYRYSTDAFGFPLTPSVEGLPADIQEERTTRIHIGDTFRYEHRFLPGIAVKYSSGNTYHISINQNQTTKYRLDLVVDGYGDRSYIHVPTHKVYAGAWEQTFEVMIGSESIQDREELSDIVSSFFIGESRQELYEAGLFIRNVSIGGENEELFGNNHIYKQSITLNCYSEWRKELPIENLLEVISICFDYNVFSSESASNVITISEDDVT